MGCLKLKYLENPSPLKVVYSANEAEQKPAQGFWSLDPVIKYSLTPYNSMSNNPVVNTDPRGDDDYFDENGNFLFSDYGMSYFDSERRITVTIKSNNIKVIKLQDYNETLKAMDDLKKEGVGKEDQNHFLIVQVAGKSDPYNNEEHNKSGLTEKIVHYYAGKVGYSENEINRLSSSGNGLGASSDNEGVVVSSNLDAYNLRALLLKELFHLRFYERNGIKSSEDWKNTFENPMVLLNHDLEGYYYFLLHYKNIFRMTTENFKDNFITGAGAFIGDLYGYSEYWKEKFPYWSEYAEKAAIKHQKNIEFLLKIQFNELKKLGQETIMSYPANTKIPVDQKDVKYDPPSFKN